MSDKHIEQKVHNALYHLRLDGVLRGDDMTLNITANGKAVTVHVDSATCARMLVHMHRLGSTHPRRSRLHFSEENGYVRFDMDDGVCVTGWIEAERIRDAIIEELRADPETMR